MFPGNFPAFDSFSPPHAATGTPVPTFDRAGPFRARSHPRRRTEARNGAGLTARLARLADPPAVPDEEVAEHRPALPREQRHQVLLDLDRVLVRREREARGEPLHVGVDHDALVDPERVAEDHVRGLAAHAWKRRELVERAGDFAAVLAHHRAREADDVLRLVPEEPGG